MFAFNHYVPVLKWKRGEQLALERLPMSTKASLTPLIEMVELPVDLETGAPTRTLDKHIDGGIEAAVAAWGNASRFFLDPEDIAQDTTTSGVDGTTRAFTQAAAAGLQFIPVTGYSRTPTEVGAALAHNSRGIAIRVTLAEVSSATFVTDLQSFIATHSLPCAQSDLLIDLADIGSWPLAAVVAFVRQVLQTVPSQAAWRTLTLLASAFPVSMQGLTSGLLVERKEWQLWQALHAGRTSLVRLPTFGDYGIQHPEGLDGFDPRFMLPSAGIRYTLPADWLLIRGGTRKVASFVNQFPALAAQLGAHASFYGPAHCPGCGEAAACAAGQGGFGSLEVWRRIGTAHHLTVASAQLAAVAFP